MCFQSSVSSPIEDPVNDWVSNKRESNSNQAPFQRSIFTNRSEIRWDKLKKYVSCKTYNGA